MKKYLYIVVFVLLLPIPCLSQVRQNTNSSNSSAALWGSITGTIGSQTDLNNALNAKANKGPTSKALIGTDSNGQMTDESGYLLTGPPLAASGMSSNTNTTLSVNAVMNTVNISTASKTWQMPPAATITGANTGFLTIGTYTVKLKPNASEQWVVNGVLQTGGYIVTSPGVTGDYVTVYSDGTYLYILGPTSWTGGAT